MVPYIQRFSYVFRCIFYGVRAVSSGVEHLFDVERAIGSIPILPTTRSVVNDPLSGPTTSSPRLRSASTVVVHKWKWLLFISWPK